MAKLETLIAYLRISSEDQHMQSAGQSESHSIGNQRAIIHAYVNGAETLSQCKLIELVDDGYSGTNFDRPAIRKALSMLHSGEAGGIIVKDLSRFGRSYIDVGNYLEQVFPFLGIRFISVNDGYDSIDPTCVGSLLTVFKTLYADLYSKDLSIKVKSALHHKAKQGEFLSASAPYGYAKSATMRNRLEIDEAAAEIIRYIFHSYVGGKNKNDIARRLNQQGVPTPMEHKQKMGYTQGWERMVKGNKPLWTGHTVLKILQDSRYIGTVVYGKTRKGAVHSKQQLRVKKEDWITAPDMHDGLITKELFHEAQSLISIFPIGEVQRQSSLLERKIACATCGRSLTLVRSKNPFYYCKTRQYTDAFSCDSLHVSASDVYETVLSALQTQVEFSVDMKKIRLLKDQGRQADLRIKQAECKRFKHEINQCKRRKKELLQAFFQQEVDPLLFRANYDESTKKEIELTKKLSLLSEELAIFQDDTALNHQFDRGMKGCSKEEGLSDDLLHALIAVIKVYDESRIELVWTFGKEPPMDTTSLAVYTLQG